MGLSIRLVPEPAQTGHWAVAFRNDGPKTLSDIEFHVYEGGIPCPGDLGSTIIRTRKLNMFGPSDELRLGSFGFVPDAEYLGLPLLASLHAEGQCLLSLEVTTQDFDRIEELGATMDLE